MVCIINVNFFTLAWKMEKVVDITFKHLKKLEYLSIVMVYSNLVEISSKM